MRTIPLVIAGAALVAGGALASIATVGSTGPEAIGSVATATTAATATSATALAPRTSENGSTPGLLLGPEGPRVIDGTDGLDEAGSLPAFGPADQEMFCRQGRDLVAGYDEKFQFARMQFGGGGGGFGRRSRDPGWKHDHPQADCQILQIMQFVTLVDTDLEHHVEVQFGDSALFRYPFVYVSEAGGWFPTEEDVENFRNYLLKGGFVVFDDFDSGRDFAVWEAAMLRVLPDFKMIELVDGTHEIYNVFFEIPDPHIVIDMTGGGWPATYYGLYLGDDPEAPLFGIANFDQDIGEFWEYNARGLVAIDLGNEAFKIGVNYMIYSMLY